MRYMQHEPTTGIGNFGRQGEEIPAFDHVQIAPILPAANETESAIPRVSYVGTSPIQINTVRRETVIDNADPDSFLSDIVPIYHAADEVERINPRVGYLCRLYALEKVHRLDPKGLQKFKSALIHRLYEQTPTMFEGERNSDFHEMQAFYQHYHGHYIKGLQDTNRAGLKEAYQTADVLFEVLKAVSLKESVDVADEILITRTEVAEKAEEYDQEISDEALVRIRYPKISKLHALVAERAKPPTHNIVPSYPESSYQVPIRRPQTKGGLLKIPLQAIKSCTRDFNETNFIGKGGYGRVYKGILCWADHVDEAVAVKRLDVTGCQGNKEFYNEVTMLSRYQHENIISLIGFCDDNKEMILVYEYATHGSLDMYLRGNAMLVGLTWPQLMTICIGVASALDYLHNHVAEKHRIIHRDIKSANILLDENWNSKLSDFGLSRIGLANQQDTFVITHICGTHGYCDPQYERTGFLTKESDVYSFGVVLFEVLCGRLACVLSYHDERRFLHHLARTSYKNGDLHGIVDQRIRKEIKPTTLLKFSAIAYQCLQETREARPKIGEVVFQLKEAMKDQLLCPF